MQVYIKPCESLKGILRAQPSKNYTTRYLLAASLAKGESFVHRPAKSEDAVSLISCLKTLGAEITEQEGGVRIKGFAGSPKSPGQLNPHNAGAVLRLLLGVGCLVPRVRFVTDFPDSLGKRPNQDLLDALSQLGVKSESNKGRLPITLFGDGLHGGKVRVSGAKSSQFLSSLLFLSPLIGGDVEIEVIHGLKSKPAVRTTLEVLSEAGIRYKAAPDLMHFYVPGNQRFKAGEFEVNGDWPGSVALLCAAAICPGSDVTLEGLLRDQQGEQAAPDVLKQMGADISFDGYRARVKGGCALKGVEFDGDKATDAVLALVGAACFAKGPTRFYNVENLRLKECDRISEPLAELCRIGVESEEKQDEIIIHGNPNGYEGSKSCNGRGDHRVIMLLSILALRTRKGLSIKGAEHIAKSYPDFFRHLELLGAEIKYNPE